MTCQRGARTETKPCRYCGAVTVQFEDELGCRRQLETVDVPARVQLTNYTTHVWELSPYRSIGWQLLDCPQRSWRPQRLEHLCEGNALYLSGTSMKVSDTRQ